VQVEIVYLQWSLELSGGFRRPHWLRETVPHLRCPTAA